MPDVNFTAIDATPATQPIGATQNPDGSFVFQRTSEHRKATFRYAGNFAPTPSPTDVIMIKGSATATLRIKRIMLSGVATANGNIVTTLLRRSSQFTTQGSAQFNAITGGKHDPNDAAPTGVVATLSVANPTVVGTLVANLGQGRLFLAASGTGQPAPLVWEFATRQDKALILRGATDFIFVNFNGAAVPAGGLVDYEIEIEEDGS